MWQGMENEEGYELVFSDFIKETTQDIFPYQVKERFSYFQSQIKAPPQHLILMFSITHFMVSC